MVKTKNYQKLKFLATQYSLEGLLSEGLRFLSFSEFFSVLLKSCEFVISWTRQATSTICKPYASVEIPCIASARNKHCPGVANA